MQVSIFNRTMDTMSHRRQRETGICSYTFLTILEGLGLKRRDRDFDSDINIPGRQNYHRTQIGDFVWRYTFQKIAFHQKG